ncbi:exodeoxyribonuclease VIII [Pectobacterium odoriferum]|uniref:PD-(D/E)XK nuclease-like domain-containing protein n=1 Tax=Pectobacterium odoriferum TaxID=78398 RepID=UPI000CD19D81|nr:PD-(D/E)XK nuclease-like domain-containing protein [Pectobacterium odoriferum]POE22838.1 exodeoxyribonuclease VIII [Pectobacterium odoriferum]
MKPGIYFDIPNEDYHADEGISKSKLDMVDKSSALIPWYKEAPIDKEKLSALDMGSAIHCAVLEPDEFSKRFIKSPKFNLRTNKGKLDQEAFLVDCEDSGKTVLDYEQHRKINLMAGSIYAHPAARALLDMPGYSEPSIYWIDDETENLLKIRPDRLVKDRPIILDLKKTADMDRLLRWHIEEFRYHVQDAMYSDGAQHHFGEPYSFVFIAVSETIDCGRYPVRVFTLEPSKKKRGHDLYRINLLTYSECKRTGHWGGIEII